MIQEWIDKLEKEIIEISENEYFHENDPKKQQKIFEKEIAPRVQIRKMLKEELQKHE